MLYFTSTKYYFTTDSIEIHALNVGCLQTKKTHAEYQFIDKKQVFLFHQFRIFGLELYKRGYKGIIFGLSVLLSGLLQSEH